jgi:hypothetical protein
VGTPKHRLCRAVPLLLLLATAACGGPSEPPPPPEATASGSTPAPSAVAGTEAEAWKLKGAAEVPPASVRQGDLGSISLSNQTGGAVSDADAHAWAMALVRSSNYDDWALNRMQDGFLLRGGLSSVPQAVFAAELGVISAARTAGAHVEARPQTIRRLVLRPVPDSLKQFFGTQLMNWSPYAFYVDKIGPSEVAYVDAAGTRTVRSRLAAGVGAPELFAGQLVRDPVLGDFWRLDSDFDCAATASRQRLGAACEP